MLPDDWAEVRRIYLEGIATGNATFETDARGLDRAQLRENRFRLFHAINVRQKESPCGRFRQPSFQVCGVKSLPTFVLETVFLRRSWA